MKMTIKFVIIGFLLLNIRLVNAQVDPINNEGIAIGGYDVVNYFTTGNPIKGSRAYYSIHGGVTYLFSSSNNKKLFESNPSNYLPQFDGYCALAVSYGKKISINPETFKIVGDKLYLFYHTKSENRETNSLETWNKNENKLLQKADQLWPDVKKKKYESEKLF